MAVLPLPRAARRRAPFDPRIAIGVLLVAVSIAGTVLLVQSQARTTTVWAARGPLLAGERVTAGDLLPVQVRLGDETARYLAGALPAGGLVATREVADGELVPLSALGSAAAADTASVVVPLSGALTASAQPGAAVDVWAAAKTSPTATTFGAPVVIVSGAVVARLVQPSGLLQYSSTQSVELQVPRDSVAALLEAVADGSRITAVTVGAAP